MIRWLPAVLLLGCGGSDGPAPNKLMDTGWFTNTEDFGTEGCAQRLAGSAPESGVTDWYWRDSLSVWFDEAADAEAYWVQFTDALGVPVPGTPVWSEDGLMLNFELSEPLLPSTDYIIIATDCAGTTEVAFSTSNIGEPLQIAPSELIGRTWSMEMLGADWVEPVGAESLIQLYFSNPALLGVRHADEAVIDVLGAPGELDAFGALVQGLGSTWNFPVADFTGAPFFASDADVVVFQYNGVQIPIHEAHLEATIAPDGNSIDGGRLSGLGDTRKLGELVGSSIDNYDALCGLAAGLGVDCVACPDGEAYCLPLKANDIHGERIEGLVLNPVFD